MLPRDLELQVRRNASETVLAVSGEADLTSADRLRAACRDLRAEPSGTRVRLDLRGLEFIDSTAMTVLLDLERGLAAQGRELTVARSEHPGLARAFALVGFEAAAR